MKTKKAIFFLFVFLSYIPVLAQVDTAWVRRYNGPGNSFEFANALAVDNNGNVYVTGSSSGDSVTTADYATIKYSPTGETLWVRRYNGPGSVLDDAHALAVDNNGNVYVTGSSSGDSVTTADYATIKYSSTGDTLWLRRYNGPENTLDLARSLCLDDSGNVYVTGLSRNSVTLSDYATIKYSPSGETLWVRGYNGPGNDQDGPLALVVDDSGNVYVTGWSIGTIYPDYDYATIKYSPAGETLWVRRYNGPGNGSDVAVAVAIDGTGNVYVTGRSLGRGTSVDYATIKYSPAGDTLWVRRFDGLGNGDDAASALAVDDSGNVYVTGSSFGLGTFSDFATIKYTPNGDILWVKRYNGQGNGIDGASALAVDDSGNVFVTGTTDYSCDFPRCAGDYTTIKYAPNGDILWVKGYNGPGNGADRATALVLDDNGNVYVTGYSAQNFIYFYNYDYATIKYVQFSCIAMPGDADGDIQVLFSDIVTMINFLFKSQPAPNPSCRADANADGNVLLPDIVYLINFLFKSGPAPQKSRECCL